MRDLIIVEGSIALVLVLPVVAVFAHRGYAPVALVMAAVAATRLAPWKTLAEEIAAAGRLKTPRAIAPIAAAGFCLWIALTEFWSPTPGAHWLALSTAAAFVAPYLIASEVYGRDSRDIKILAAAFCAAALLALALFLFEAHTQGYLRLIAPPPDTSPDRFDDITSLGRGLTALTPSLYPAAAIAFLFAAAGKWRRRTIVLGLSLIFLAAFSAALELTIAANSAAVLAGALAAAAGCWRPRATVTVLVFAFALALVLAPGLAAIPAETVGDRLAGVAPLSWLQRLHIWRSAGIEALSCLPFGCGADYAREMAAARETFTVGGSPELLLMPLHPHNVFLQIWLELGLPGVILAALAILAGGRRLADARLQRPAIAAIAGALAATLVYWSVEASLWQAWRLASIAIAAGGVAIAARLAEGRAL